MNNLQSLIKALKSVKAPSQEEMKQRYNQGYGYITLGTNFYSDRLSYNIVKDGETDKFSFGGFISLTINFTATTFMNVYGDGETFKEQLYSVITSLENLLEVQDED